MTWRKLKEYFWDMREFINLINKLLSKT